MDYKLEICPNEDYELIKDLEEREEAEDKFFDEVEGVYKYIVNFIDFYKTDITINFEQITDTIFNIKLSNRTEEKEKHILNLFEEGLKFNLDVDDIAFYTLENYIEA